MRSFQAKLLYLMVAVLVLFQAATLIAVHIAGRQTIEKDINKELQVGAGILDQILSGKGKELSGTVRILATDYAFREAVALDDAPTIASALVNHASRISADAAFLISLDGKVVADTFDGHWAGRPFPLRGLLSEAEKQGESSGIVFVQRPPLPTRRSAGARTPADRMGVDGLRD